MKTSETQSSSDMTLKVMSLNFKVQLTIAKDKDYLSSDDDLFTDYSSDNANDGMKYL